jgi:hypothetical protein
MVRMPLSFGIGRPAAAHRCWQRGLCPWRSIPHPAIEGSFRLLDGQPTIYVKTAESSNRRNLAFCPRCGTAIYSAPPDANSHYFGLRVGALRQRRDLIPHTQEWRRSALPWVDHLKQMQMVLHDTG